MKEIVKFLTKTYTRRMLLQLLIAFIVAYIGLRLEDYYNDNNYTPYAAKWTIILFFAGGTLSITTILLIVEYVQHILTILNIIGDKNHVPEVLNDWDKQTNSNSVYDIDYIGPRISSIILLPLVVIVSFFAVIYGVFYGLESFLASFGIGADPHVPDLEFKLFLQTLKYL